MMFDLTEFLFERNVAWCEEEAVVEYTADMMVIEMMAEREKLLKEAVKRATGFTEDVVLYDLIGSNKLELVKLASDDVDKYFFDGLPLIEFYNSAVHVVVDSGKAVLNHKYRMLV